MEASHTLTDVTAKTEPFSIKLPIAAWQVLSILSSMSKSVSFLSWPLPPLREGLFTVFLILQRPLLHHLFAVLHRVYFGKWSLHLLLCLYCQLPHLRLKVHLHFLPALLYALEWSMSW
jgi:hypothetical protein